MNEFHAMNIILFKFSGFFTRKIQMNFAPLYAHKQH